jgi:hypothetical protein
VAKFQGKVVEVLNNLERQKLVTIASVVTNCGRKIFQVM